MNSRRIQLKTTAAGAAILSAALPALVCLGLGLSQLWPIAVVLGALVAVFTLITVNGKLLGRYLFRRRHGGRQVYNPQVQPRVIRTNGADVAYLWSAKEAQVIACIEFAPNLSLPTTVAPDGPVFTEDTVPLKALAAARSQYGLQLDIDVISAGARVAGPVGALHNTVIPRFVSQRRTWAVVRLGLTAGANLAVTRSRGPVDRAAPKALAAAAQRIALACRMEGVRAEVVDSVQALIDAQAFLNMGLPAEGWREQWSEMVNDSSRSRTTARAARIAAPVSTELVESVWAHPALYTTMSLRVTSNEDKVATAGSVIFFDGVKPTDEPLPAGLQLAYGDQGAVFGACQLAYGPPQPPPPSRPPGVRAADDLALAVGPSGQVVGRTASGRLVGIQIYDSSLLDPHPTRIAVAADWFPVAQVALRSVADGLSVSIHTDRPGQWESMVSQLAHAGLSFGGEADVAIIDGAAAPATAARTIITVYPTIEQASAASADITITQPNSAVPVIAVDLHRPGFRAAELELITPRAEQRYTGVFEPTTGMPLAPSPRPVDLRAKAQQSAPPAASPVVPREAHPAAPVAKTHVLGAPQPPTSVLSATVGEAGQDAAVVPHNARHRKDPSVEQARAAIERARERARARERSSDSQDK